jgi:hypothetical protein
MSRERFLWPACHLYTLWHDTPEAIQGADIGHGHKVRQQREYEDRVLSWLYKEVLHCPQPEELEKKIAKGWDDVIAYAEVHTLCSQPVIDTYQSRRLFDHVPLSVSTCRLVRDVAETSYAILVDEFVNETARWSAHLQLDTVDTLLKEMAR